jgi:hypothetical protein
MASEPRSCCHNRAPTPYPGRHGGFQRRHGIVSQVAAGQRLRRTVLANTPNQTFESHFTAVAEIVLGIVLNIASSAAWDGFVYLLSMLRLRAQELRQLGAQPQSRIILGITRNPDGSSVFWQDLSGPSEEVLEAARSAVRDYMSTNLGNLDTAHGPNGEAGQISSNESK